MDKSTEKQIQKWCQSNRWTELFTQKGQYYAFPPGAVIPLPVPTEAIEEAKITQERKVHNSKQLLSTILSSLAVIVLTDFFGLPLWSSLLVMMLLNIIVIILDNLWNWLWLNMTQEWDK